MSLTKNENQPKKRRASQNNLQLSGQLGLDYDEIEKSVDSEKAAKFAAKYENQLGYDDKLLNYILKDQGDNHN